MSQAQTTICPKCGTGFQVSAQQLSKANGKVRCGACLTIFIASDNMAGAAKNAAVVKKRESDIPSFANDDDDASMFMFGAADDVVFDDEPKPKPKAATKPVANKKIAPQLIEEEFIFQDGDDEDDYIFQDGDDEDDKSPDSHSHSHSKSAQLSDSEIDDLYSNNDDAFGGIGEIDENFMNVATDDTLDPFEEEVTKASDAIELTGKDVEDESWAEALLAEEDKKANAAPKKLEIVKAKPDPLRHVSRIQSAPVEIEFAESKSWLSTVIWFCLTCFAALLLVLQYAVYNKNELAKNASYRPFFVVWCSMAGCGLPALQEIRKLKTPNLQLKKANESNKHQVVVIVNNSANFEQPFPMVKMKFSDSNDRLIALEEVPPSIYLTGDLAGLKAMPANVDVQLSFLVDSPSASVSSCQIEFAAIAQ